MGISTSVARPVARQVAQLVTLADGPGTSEPTVPDSAITDRTGEPILDRDTDYILARDV